VLALTTSNTGTFWLCSSLTGLTTWDGQPGSSPEVIKEVTGRPCAVAYRDRRGRIWIGFGSGGGGGAALVENGRLRVFGTADGVAPGTAVAITEDRSGSIWLTTAGGLHRYKDGRFLAITPPQVPLTDILPTLVEDGRGLPLGRHVLGIPDGPAAPARGRQARGQSRGVDRLLAL
jgi:ligand-binding sensor domain-containing protein